MSDEDEFRMVNLSRKHLDEILASYGPDIADARARLEAAWDKAPEDAWAEIADEFRRHRCKDGNCFAESVLMRLGAITFPAGPWDLPEVAS